jgi:4-phospho-D-threonate 3-dehydrogenase / 4-phospho-D-erythronate 3-dehydrogenase
MSKKPLVALTMGDPAGIGPELCLTVMNEPTVASECRLLVFGDAGILLRASNACAFPMPKRVTSLEDWKSDSTSPQESRIIDCQAIEASLCQPGTVQAECGRAAFTYIAAAIEAALQNKVAAVCTAPINKEALRAAGLPYPGHTEIFAALTEADEVCMMLASDELKVSMVTTHVGFKEVPGLITAERVARVIELTADALRRMLGNEPRIAVCGLNPHAGEHGLFGDWEEERLVAPGIEAAKSRGIHVQGPFPPDAAFVPAHRRRFHAIVCMYHDQGHIPFKMLAFDTGVNMTLGTSVIRTSVDHGTAFDIAWQGRADPGSMTQALLWAARLSRMS